MLTLIVVLCLAIIGGGTYLFTGLFHLVAGWVFYVVETWPRVQIQWAGVATFVVGITILLVLAQSFCRWLAPESQWRWSWTVKCLAIILLAFTAGICAVGIVHQVGWLATSKEPIFHNRSIVNYTFSGISSSAIAPVPTKSSSREGQP